MDKPSAARPPHPIVYLLLFLPFGITSGYVTVTLAYLLSAAGASVAAIAALVGMSVLPNTWKVLWAPIVDTTLSAKRWYLISVVISAAALVASGLTPLTVAMLPVFSTLTFLTGVSITFSAMATERLMAFGALDHQKGRAGGWSQAGNLGGAGLGGGAGLWVAQHSHVSWLSGVSLGLACLACAAVLPWLTEEPRRAQRERYHAILVQAARDVWGLLKSRIGLLACFICLLPIGTGAASNLWSAVAKDWGAGADEVALVGGVLSGLVTLVGSVAGGYLCDRIGRKRGYLLFGVLSAAAGLAMAAGPRTPLAFMALASVYNLIVGFSYGGFSAVALEAVGQGAAATKYNLIASLSNVPILVMTLALGAAEARWGSGGMLVFEAVVSLAAAVLFCVVAYATRGMSWSRFRSRAAAG